MATPIHCWASQGHRRPVQRRALWVWGRWWQEEPFQSGGWNQHKFNYWHESWTAKVNRKVGFYEVTWRLSVSSWDFTSCKLCLRMWKPHFYSCTWFGWPYFNGDNWPHWRSFTDITKLSTNKILAQTSPWTYMVLSMKMLQFMCKVLHPWATNELKRTWFSW